MLLHITKQCQYERHAANMLSAVHSPDNDLLHLYMGFAGHCTDSALMSCYALLRLFNGWSPHIEALLANVYR